MIRMMTAIVLVLGLVATSAWAQDAARSSAKAASPSASMLAGLEASRQVGFGGVIVLGHPKYYPRFGFQPASHFGLRCEYDVPDDVFMALELAPGTFNGKTGTIRYHPAFARL